MGEVEDLIKWGGELKYAALCGELNHAPFLGVLIGL